MEWAPVGATLYSGGRIMLVLTLICSTALLGIVYFAVYRSKRPFLVVLGVSAAFSFGTVPLGLILPTVTVLGVLLMIAIGVWAWLGRGAKSFVPLSGVAIIGAFAFATWTGW